MPAYNCQKRFVPLILGGLKPHMIRKRRKHPTKVGDTLYLFTGLRTKQTVRFAETVCTKIQPVYIYPFRKEIEFVTDLKFFTPLSRYEKIELARRDGFNSVGDFFDFFKRYKNDELGDFEIIYWNPKQVRFVVDDPLMPDVILWMNARLSVKASALQRNFRIGYARAMSMIDKLERLGVVGKADENLERPLLISPLLNVKVSDG